MSAKRWCALIGVTVLLLVALQCAVCWHDYLFSEVGFAEAASQFREFSGIEIPVEGVRSRAATRSDREADYWYFRFSASDADVARMLEMPEEMVAPGQYLEDWVAEEYVFYRLERAREFSSLEWMQELADDKQRIAIAAQCRSALFSGALAARRVGGDALDVRLYITRRFGVRGIQKHPRFGWTGYFWGTRYQVTGHCGAKFKCKQ